MSPQNSSELIRFGYSGLLRQPKLRVGESYPNGLDSMWSFLHHRFALIRLFRGRTFRRTTS
jgi:hypothetical protein